MSYDVLRKAISDKRITYEVNLSLADKENSISKEERNQKDEMSAELLGVGCTRFDERLAAAAGVLQLAESRFEHQGSVTYAGVLFALPALISNGLFFKLKDIFTEFDGYYSLTHILTLVAFMALCRIKTVEQLRFYSPGELGSLLGLDRIPEVKCLRQKLSDMSKNSEPQKWSRELSQKWMDESPELVGALYIDGHVRLYGGQEKLPKLYVSRERLCLKGVMDFWVNDKLGQPFFVIRTEVNPGMISVLRNEIVPRLLAEVPNQPSKEELDNNPELHRFILVFDREGYSPFFFKEMWVDHRIACMTYHKHAGEDWPQEEFKEVSVKLISGETTSMKLASRRTSIGHKKNEKMEVVEVRKLTKNSHQTSIISTAYTLKQIEIAVLMFARWCQENFFNYMMQHFAIDSLTEYKKQDVSATTQVVSPQWRALTKLRNSLSMQLKTQQAKVGRITLEIDEMIQEDSDKKMDQLHIKRAESAEEAAILSQKLAIVKEDIKQTPQRILIEDLPESEQFKQLAPSKKDLIDTIKMIAYRAETAMATILIEGDEHISNARSLLQNIFKTEADLIPNYENKTLEVRLHSLASRSLNTKVDPLIRTLNESKVFYPGTNLRLIYSRIGAQSH